MSTCLCGEDPRRPRCAARPRDPADQRDVLEQGLSGDTEPAFADRHTRLKAAYEELSEAKVLQPAGQIVTVQVRHADESRPEHLQTYRLTHATRMHMLS